MPDLFYVAGTILFFALMLAYTRICAALGARADVEAAKDPTS